MNTIYSKRYFQCYVKLIGFWLLMLLPTSLSAQGMRMFTSDDVLSSNLINALYQDRKGFIWIATEDGLNRLDEQQVTKYSHLSADSLSLKSNYVHSLYEDTRGRFWIGCISGMQRYDREYDCFRDIPVMYKGDVCNPHIMTILETQSGDIWVGTSGLGVAVVHPGSSADTISIDEDLTNRLQAYYINYLFEDQDGAIWVASEKALYRYSPLTQEILECTDKQGNSISNVMAIQSDQHGQLYVGTLNDGLFLINDHTGSLEAVPYPGQKVRNIRTLVYDARENEILIGTDGFGLYRYDIEEKTIHRPNQFSAYFDSEKAKIHCLLRDFNGNIWMAIFQKGVMLLPNSPYKFEYIGYRSSTKNLIGSYCVTALHCDDNNDLWIGTDNDGLYHLNLSTMGIKHYISSINKRVVPNTIMHIGQGNDHQFFLSSYFDGLSYFNRQNAKTDFYSGLPKEVNKVICTQSDLRGNLWVGTFGEGMYGINPKTKEIIAHEKSLFVGGKAQLNMLPNDWINCLTLDNNGLLWVGTYQGICCYDPISRAYPHIFTGTVLENAVINDILVAKDHSIWIGTTEGLYHYDPAVRKITYVSEGWDDTSQLICALVEGDDDAIWFSTHAGLYRYSLVTQGLSHFTKSDGLQGNEFSRGVVAKSPDGKLFFGGVNGVTAFYPKDIVSKQRRMSLYITSLNVNGRDIQMGIKSGGKDVINSALLTAHEINLDHTDNSFMIKFSTINYANPDKIRLLYRLLPQKEDWINTSFGTNMLSFNELRPGTYTLEVKLAEMTNISDVYKLKIRIRSPWYATSWAMIVWIVSALVLAWIISTYLHDRYKYKRNLLIREHQEQLQEAKIQYFTDISHEIRTPMTLILSPLEKLIKEHSPHQSTYKMMYRNGQTILKLINQLLDIRKIEKEQMRMHFSQVNLVEYIQNLLGPFSYDADSKQIELTYHHQETSVFTWIDYDQFDKIIINILSNAFKYTPKNGHVEVELTIPDLTSETRADFPDGYVEIQVKDDGPGIPSQMLDEIFERFSQADNAMAGTGIGLHLAYKLVQLHRGEIFASNRPTGGACFTIRIPLGMVNVSQNKSILSSSDTIPPAVKSEQNMVMAAADELGDASAMSRKRKPQIFFSEDNDEIRQYLVDELKDFYNVETFQDGKALYDVIKRTRPDLVISDVMMPEMDGETLCAAIKNNPATSDIPVILLTARVLNEELISGLESGADAYLVKPFNIDVLKATINNQLLNRKRLLNRKVTDELVEQAISHPEVQSADEQLMERVMKTIDAHLSDTNLTVELLASEVGMSRVHLHRKVKQLTNLTPSALIRTIRLDRAAELLTKKELTVSDAAYATGFINITHFSSSFKEKFGMPPSQYPGNKND